MDKNDRLSNKINIIISLATYRLIIISNAFVMMCAQIDNIFIAHIKINKNSATLEGLIKLGAPRTQPGDEKMTDDYISSNIGTQCV